jgi:hypothetical protein
MGEIVAGQFFEIAGDLNPSLSVQLITPIKIEEDFRITKEIAIRSITQP